MKLFVVLSMLLLAACATAPTKPSPYTKLFIVEPAYANDITSRMDYSDQKIFDQIRPKLSSIFKETLINEIDRKQFIKISPIDSKDKETLVVSCKFTDGVPGSIAMRLLLGGGAGRTVLATKCVLKDNEGRFLAKEEKDENVSGPFRFSSFESYFYRFTKEMSEDYAGFVEDYIKSNRNN